MVAENNKAGLAVKIEQWISQPNSKFIIRLIAFLIGIGMGLFGVFQVLFLYRVLPHGGL